MPLWRVKQNFFGYPLNPEARMWPERNLPV